MELQDSTVCFLYDQLRVETIRYLEDYIKSERGTLAELKDRFRRSLPEEERRRVRTVKKLVDALEERSVIGPNNVKVLKMLAEALKSRELKENVEEFETKCSGIFQRILNAAAKAPGFVWQTFKGGVCTSAIYLKTVLSIRGVPMTLAGTTLMYIFGTNPEQLQKLQPFLDFGAKVVALFRGSVVFVLKVSSISSLKQLWQSYKDGSLKEKLKKALNEMKELKEVSQGEEIDVEVTIDEEEYREALLDLMLLEVKGNSTKNTKTQRRHSICCERDVTEENSKPVDLTQIQIRVGRPVMELEKSIDSIKRLKERLLLEGFRGGFEYSKIVKIQEQRLSEIKRQLSEMEIFLAAAGFSEITLKEAAEKIRLAKDVKRNIPLMEGKSSAGSGSQMEPYEHDEEEVKFMVEESSAGSGLQFKGSLPSEHDEPEAAPRFSGIRWKEAHTKISYLQIPSRPGWKLCTGFGRQTWESSSTSLSKGNEKEQRPSEIRRQSWKNTVFLEQRPSEIRRQSWKNTVFLGERPTYKPKRKLQRLRDNQKELAAPALEGKNTIICAPTNSGKTLVAMEIIERHIDANKILKPKLEVESPKVIFVVDKQNLLYQRALLFEEYLTDYSISAISGNNSDVVPLHHIIQDNDIVVLTAQILVNALKGKKVSINDITLLVFDECHHANKNHPYGQIMQEYLKTKLYSLETTGKKVPQVVGLTTSLGVFTKEQVLQMCANLDASNISTERKRTLVQKKPNIFEKEINKAMEKIEAFIKKDCPQQTDRQDESYRLWIELPENEQGEGNQLTCTSLLRCYHEALLINSNVRIEDAILYLDEYFNGLDKSKFNETGSWLHKLFLKTKKKIEKQIKEAGRPENPLLIALQKILVDFHTKKAHGKSKAKGILFTRTRDYAHALKRWMEESEEVNKILRPEVLPDDVAQSQQEQVIKKFKTGEVNIIIATTVAEEGLDIPDCSYVICYGVKGNEITSVQSVGDMVSKEDKQVKQYKEMVLELFLEDINEEFLKMIKSRQIKSVAREKEKQTLEAMKGADDDGVTFYCKKCKALVCNAQDIRRFRHTHHVVINMEIYERIDIKPHEKPNTYNGVYLGKKIYCENCDNHWGAIITVEETEWPCLKVASFVTTLKHGKKRKHFKKWKDVPFKICEATLEEMMTNL